MDLTRETRAMFKLTHYPRARGRLGGAGGRLADGGAGAGAGARAARRSCRRGDGAIAAGAGGAGGRLGKRSGGDAGAGRCEGAVACILVSISISSSLCCQPGRDRREGSVSAVVPLPSNNWDRRFGRPIPLIPTSRCVDLLQLIGRTSSLRAALRGVAIQGDTRHHARRPWIATAQGPRNDGIAAGDDDPTVAFAGASRDAG